MSVKASWPLPLALVIRPFTSYGNDVPSVTADEPKRLLRCYNCRTYINPCDTILASGMRWKCCMCGMENDVPEGELPLGARVETQCGSVQYFASQDYAMRPPMPPCYLFVIDVSAPAVSCGAVAAACAAIKSNLAALDARNSLTKVGLLTYDSNVHFYNLNPGLAAPQMLVVSDVDDPFPPLPDDHFVALEASRAILEATLDLIPESFRETTNFDSALVPALQAAFRTMSAYGGKLMLFAVNPATVGEVCTGNRSTPALYGTDKEVTLRRPSHDFFQQFTGECLAKQISVDLFVMASKFMDLFSLDTLPRYTNGTLYTYPGFLAARDGDKLAAEVTHNLTRSTGWEGVMRIRCSPGVQASSFHGHLYVRSKDLVTLPSISSDTTIVVQLAMQEAVLATESVYVQCAVLYTDEKSARRICVHTMRLPTLASAFAVFEAGDALASAVTLAKLTVEKAQQSRLDETRRALEDKVARQLKEYKGMIGSSSLRGRGPGPGALLVPSNLANLLPWVHGALHDAALRGAADVDADVRCARMSLLLMAPLELVMVMLYPFVFPLHRGGWGALDESGQLQMPATVPATFGALESHGAYLVDAGTICFLLICPDASTQLVQDLLGPVPPEALTSQDYAQVDHVSLDRVPSPGPLGQRTRQLLATRRAGRAVWPMCLTVALPSSVYAGYASQFMTEDHIPPGAPAYFEFLTGMHRRLTLR